MKVLKIKENKDGSATIDIEVAKFERKAIKRKLGIKRLTNQRLEKFLLDSIIEYANKKREEE